MSSACKSTGIQVRQIGNMAPASIAHALTGAILDDYLAGKARVVAGEARRTA